MTANKTELTQCPECKGPLTFKHSGRTMVGYGGYQAPHDHDDNCVTHEWWCMNGHIVCERQQNYCPAEGCEWKGKTDCFCSKLGIRVYSQKITVTRDGEVVDKNY